ncbi:MAG TPA: ankyrin repeat domain-containing protein [Myxococcales bacterium]
MRLSTSWLAPLSAVLALLLVPAAAPGAKAPKAGAAAKGAPDAGAPAATAPAGKTPATVLATKSFPGFTIASARNVPKALQSLKRGDAKVEEELAKLEAEAQASLDRSVKAAQAMFDHFRAGKHGMLKGVEPLLDLSERPADDKKLPWIAIGLADADKGVNAALKAAGLELSWIRLHTNAKASPEMIARVQAAFLMCQVQAGGPLTALPKDDFLTSNVPATLLAGLDRVGLHSVVLAWQVRDHLKPIGLNSEQPKADGREGETARAKVVARVWTHLLEDQPLPEVIYESAERLGPEDVGGLLELMARGSPEARVGEVSGFIFKKFNKDRFGPLLEPLRGYLAKAFDFPTPEALIAAVQDGDLGRVQRLLKAGAPANARDADKVPAMLLAIELEKADIAMALGEGGADLGALDREGRSIFELAVWKRQTELVKALAPKADFQDKARAAGEKALLQAVRDEDVESVQALLKAGANPNVRDSDKTPLLVQAASAKKALELVEAIAGAPQVKLDETDRDKKTALMMAAEQGKVEPVKALMKRGARTELKSKRGRTAAELAEEAGYQDVAAALRGR